MKKILLIVLSLGVCGLVWYLFIKKYDYQFETTAKYGSGAVYYELAGWDRFSPSGNAEIEIVREEPFNSLTQRLKIDSSSFLNLKWELENINDSVTGLTLNILTEKDKLANRWDIVNPFQKSIYLDSIKRNLLSFKKNLNEHQQAYKISAISGVVETPRMECICSTSRNIPIAGKASEMMKTIPLLENYLLANDLKLNDPPILKVTKWNRSEDRIDFDFCFPLENIVGLKPTQNISLKSFPPVSSLKVIFNGNYRLSHIAWYDILFKAEEKEYDIEPLPLEIFYDNPKVDSNELNWKAEIYLPVKQ